MTKNASSDRFELRVGVSGTNRDEWDVVSTYETGKDAAAAKGSMVCPFGKVFAVVRVAADDEGDAGWREREGLRFTEGRYKRVPWDVLSEASVGDWASSYPDHFVHIAESDSRKVAFTESDAKGRKDIQKVLSPADYLARFYSGSLPSSNPHWYGNPRMAESLKRDICELMAGLSTEVQFASTADDIQSIYEESGGTDCELTSCGSCMGYSASRYGTSGIHPTRVYAAGDLQLAYLRNDDGKLVARALVWPEKLSVGRVYGQSTNALKTGLRAKGYTRIFSDSLIGARLMKLPLPYHDDGDDACFVMPYLDGSCRFENSEDGEHFLIASEDGKNRADRTDGRGYIRGYKTCCVCEDDIPNHRAYSIGEDAYCRECYNSHCVQCDECYTVYDNENESMTEVMRPSPYNRGRLYEANVCSNCLDHYTATHDGTFYPDDAVSECVDCPTIARTDDMHAVDDGYQCEDCHEQAQEAEIEDADASETNALIAS